VLQDIEQRIFSCSWSEQVRGAMSHGPLDISTWTHNWSGGCTNWGQPTETDCSITLLWAAAAAATQL